MELAGPLGHSPQCSTMVQEPVPTCCCHVAMGLFQQFNHQGDLPSVNFKGTSWATTPVALCLVENRISNVPALPRHLCWYMVHTEPEKPAWKTWEIGHFYKKSGKTWNSQGTSYNFYPSQGKVRENKKFSLHIIFINYWQSHCSNCCQ